MKEFHAQAIVFNLFYVNFQLNMAALGEQVTKLEQKNRNVKKIIMAMLVFRRINFHERVNFLIYGLSQVDSEVSFFSAIKFIVFTNCYFKHLIIVLRLFKNIYGGENG